MSRLEVMSLKMTSKTASNLQSQTQMCQFLWEEVQEMRMAHEPQPGTESEKVYARHAL